MLDSRETEAARFAATHDIDADVDQVIRPQVESGHTAGIVAGLLLPDGSMRFYGYGTTDRAGGPRPDGDTQFAIGSLSKGFLAALVALHVDRGELSWDETLETLLPPGTKLSADARRITLRELATHTSGLPRQPLTPRTLAYFLEFLIDGTNFYRHLDTAYTLHFLGGFSNDHRGERRYSNIGYGIMSYALERRTGRSVDTLLRDEIIVPMGLRCTGYDPTILPCYPGRAHPHAGDQPKLMWRGEAVPDWEFSSLLRGAAAMSSNARDLLMFARAHFTNGGTHLNAVLSGNLEPIFARPKDAPAFAWTIDDAYGEPLAYQVGFVGGYSAYLGIDPRHRTAAVVLQNSFNWDNSTGHRLLVRLRKYDKFNSLRAGITLRG